MSLFPLRLIAKRVRLVAGKMMMEVVLQIIQVISPCSQTPCGKNTSTCMPNGATNETATKSSEIANDETKNVVEMTASMGCYINGVYCEIRLPRFLIRFLIFASKKQLVLMGVDFLLNHSQYGGLTTLPEGLDGV